MNYTPYTKSDIEYIKKNYNVLPVAKIAEILDRATQAIYNKARRLGLYKNTGPGVKTKFTSANIKYLKKNWLSMTIPQMASKLGFTLTVVRDKAKVLGLRKLKHKFWTPDEVKILRANYEELGDIAIADLLNARLPDAETYQFTAKNIEKKRNYLKLLRTEEQLFKIRSANSLRTATVRQNSASLNYHATYVANSMARLKGGLGLVDYELRDELLKHTELIELKRNQLKLNRHVRNTKNK
jgi:hypothetical protein